MNNNLTFEQLPNAVSQLNEKLEKIEKILLAKSEDQIQAEQEDELLSVPEAADFLKLSPATVYSKKNRGELPYHKPGKRLYFFKKELIAYLKEGKVKSNAELQQEAEEYLTKKKGGRI